MSDHDTIVQCPGCGNGKVISMALGQLLQCDVCRTTFYAPVTDRTAASPPGVEPPVTEPTRSGSTGLESPATEPPVKVDGSVTARSSAQNENQAEDRVESGSDLASSRSGSAERKRTSSWRMDELELAVQPETTTAMGAGNGAAADGTSAAPAKKRDTPDGPSWIWSVVAVLAVGVIFSLLLVAGFFLLRALPRADDRSVVAESPESTEPVRWTDASKFSQKRGPLTLKVERAFFGTVRVKDLNRQVITTEDDHLLGITVSVANQGNRQRAFQNWYGHAFEGKQGEELIAELTDDQGRGYALLKFDDVSYVEGQRLAETVGPGESVRDTVVFLIPEEYDRSAIKYFRLTLPGAAVATTEIFRFQIPATMIKAFLDEPQGQPDGAGESTDAVL